MVSDMVTLKTSVAALLIGGTAVAASGATYAVIRASTTAQVAVSCPPPAVAAAPAPRLPSALPNGPTVSTTKGKEW
jgi:hypothetical protein